MEEVGSQESLQNDFVTIRAATDKFSEASKLGRGGLSVDNSMRWKGCEGIQAKEGDQELKNEVTSCQASTLESG